MFIMFIIYFWRNVCQSTNGKAKASETRHYVIEKLRANVDYSDTIGFGQKCLMNIASAAKFSSDKTIRQYAKEIWHIEPTKYE